MSGVEFDQVYLSFLAISFTNIYFYMYDKVSGVEENQVQYASKSLTPRMRH